MTGVQFMMSFELEFDNALRSTSHQNGIEFKLNSFRSLMMFVCLFVGWFVCFIDSLHALSVSV